MCIVWGRLHACYMSPYHLQTHSPEYLTAPGYWGPGLGLSYHTGEWCIHKPGLSLGRQILTFGHVHRQLPLVSTQYFHRLYEGKTRERPSICAPHL